MNFGESAEMDMLRECMAELDKNGDGVLDKDEFKKFFMQTIGI